VLNQERAEIMAQEVQIHPFEIHQDVGPLICFKLSIEVLNQSNNTITCDE
jgi:hypothetical protein